VKTIHNVNVTWLRDTHERLRIEVKWNKEENRWMWRTKHVQCREREYISINLDFKTDKMRIEKEEEEHEEEAKSRFW
jgi:hypothetical protein